MEPHKDLASGTELYRPDIGNGPAEYFERAWTFVNRFYGEEVMAISSTRFDEVSPGHFFREYAWVVHATGFSAKAVGKFMPRLMSAYGPWDLLAKEAFGDAFLRIKLVCNNPQKARAVHATARHMTARLFEDEKVVEWGEYKQEHLSSPERLMRLPYVGPVTCFHLARNLGLLECVKPDLHLVRLASHWGFQDCVKMCESMRDSHEADSGERVPLGLVDLAVWYLASHFGTIGLKVEGQR